MSATEARAEFRIESEISPCDHMEELIGIKPDYQYGIGDAIQGTKLRRKSYGCVFKSKLPESEGLEGHVRSLLDELGPASSKIRALAEKDYHLLFSCVIYCSERPALYFDRDVISSIENLGSDFDIDLYILPEED
jgi:hypothetical protein